MARTLPAFYDGLYPAPTRTPIGTRVILLTPVTFPHAHDGNPKQSHGKSFGIFAGMVDAHAEAVESGDFPTLASLLANTSYRNVDVGHDVEHGHIYLVTKEDAARLIDAAGACDAVRIARALVECGTVDDAVAALAAAGPNVEDVDAE